MPVATKVHVILRRFEVASFWGAIECNEYACISLNGVRKPTILNRNLAMIMLFFANNTEVWAKV